MTTTKCPCGHAKGEHSVYGCVDECGCERRPDLRATEATEQLDKAKEEHRETVADVLAAEWHRRYQRLEDLHRDPDAAATVVEHVRGELVGLRGALGILLGGQVQGGTADLLGWSYYQEWRARQEGKA